MAGEMGEGLFEGFPREEVPKHMPEDAARGGELVDPDDLAVSAVGPAIALGLLDGTDATVEPDGDNLAVVTDRGEAPEADVPTDVQVQVLGGEVTQVRQVLEEHGAVFGEFG